MRRKEKLWGHSYQLVPTLIMVFAVLRMHINPWYGFVMIALLSAFSLVIGRQLFIAVKNKSSRLKATVLGLLTLSFGLFYLMIGHYYSDTPLVDKPWQRQQLAFVAFESPEPLHAVVLNMPQGSAGFYEDMEMKVAGNDERLVMAMHVVFFNDSIDLGNAFFGALGNTASSLNIDAADISIDSTAATGRHRLEAWFTIKNGGRYHGYAYLTKKGKELVALWLYPVSRSFPPEYINKFRQRIQ